MACLGVVGSGLPGELIIAPGRVIHRMKGSRDLRITYGAVTSCTGDVPEDVLAPSGHGTGGRQHISVTRNLRWITRFHSGVLVPAGEGQGTGDRLPAKRVWGDHGIACHC